MPKKQESTTYAIEMDLRSERRKEGSRSMKLLSNYYSGRKADRVKVSVALSNSFCFLRSRWAGR